MKNVAIGDGVVTVDPHYIHPGRAAVYLIVEGGRAAFVDSNTPRALPVLLEALEAQGLGPEDVAYAIVTHVHLDHGSGTAALLGACPNAVALAHPRAVRHLVEPGRLVHSAKQVYGEEAFRTLFGSVDPVDRARVRAVEDGEEAALGSRTLTFLHTAGHARHHICIHDSGSNGVFTGDAFGVAYPSVRNGARPYLVCSTPPTEFDAEAARETVRRVVATGAERAYLTHFGPSPCVKESAEELLRSIDDMEAVRVAAAASRLEGAELQAFCEERVDEAIRRQFVRCDIAFTPENWGWHESDVRLNAQGLAYAAQRARKA